MLLESRFGRSVRVDAEAEPRVARVEPQAFNEQPRNAIVPDLKRSQHERDFTAVRAPDLFVQVQQWFNRRVALAEECIEQIVVDVVRLASNAVDEERDCLPPRPASKDRDQIAFERDRILLPPLQAEPHQGVRGLVHAFDDGSEKALVDPDAATRRLHEEVVNRDLPKMIRE